MSYCQIVTSGPGPLSPELREQLSQCSTASLTSELVARGLTNTFLTGLAPVTAARSMVGTAFTLRYIPAREDLDLEVEYDNATNPQRLAVEAVAGGEILVIDARGETGAASLGHILATRLQARGVSGLVTDGALRDRHAIAELELPCYARATHATTSSVRHHPVDFDVPIACAGVAVYPGDVLVGDRDGVVVIPRGLAGEVAEAAFARDELETYLLGRIRAGESIRDVYPPSAAVRAEYERRRGAGS
jgi:regulator of RNase E activity RraA